MCVCMRYYSKYINQRHLCEYIVPQVVAMETSYRGIHYNPDVDMQVRGGSSRWRLFVSSIVIVVVVVVVVTIWVIIVAEYRSSLSSICHSTS